MMSRDEEGIEERKYNKFYKDELVQQSKQFDVNSTPSCLSLFDAYLSCYTLKPQLLSIYRYAEYKKCDRPWDDFKWCFFNNKLDDEQKLKAWIERRADWWARRRLNRSSEDVWEAREDTEQPKTWPTSNLDPNAPLYN